MDFVVKCMKTKVHSFKKKTTLLQHLYIFSVMIPIPTYPHETKRSILLFQQSNECWFLGSIIDDTILDLDL